MEFDSILIGLLLGLLTPYILPKAVSFIKGLRKDKLEV